MTEPTALPPAIEARLGQKMWMQKFWSRVSKSDGCWIWTGQQAGNGYGRARRADGRLAPAHRVAWELHHGRSVPDGLFVCHNCPGGDNKACVNPAHLWLGTNAENIKDAYAKGFKNDNSRRTHCKDGHPLDGENLYVNPHDGRRICRECQRRLVNESRKRCTPRYTVSCLCGWRTQRVRNACVCGGVAPCRCIYGTCTKCGGVMHTSRKVLRAATTPARETA